MGEFDKVLIDRFANMGKRPEGFEEEVAFEVSLNKGIDVGGGLKQTKN